MNFIFGIHFHFRRNITYGGMMSKSQLLHSPCVYTEEKKSSSLRRSRVYGIWILTREEIEFDEPTWLDLVECLNKWLDVVVIVGCCCRLVGSWRKQNVKMSQFTREKLWLKETLIVDNFTTWHANVFEVFDEPPKVHIFLLLHTFVVLLLLLISKAQRVDELQLHSQCLRNVYKLQFWEVVVKKLRAANCSNKKSLKFSWTS